MFLPIVLARVADRLVRKATAPSDEKEFKDAAQLVRLSSRRLLLTVSGSVLQLAFFYGVLSDQGTFVLEYKVKRFVLDVLC